MKREEVISRLEELIEDRKSFMVGDYDKCYDKDVQALEYAIKEIERTAQEVPVQEQYVGNLDSRLINYISEKLSQGKITFNQARTNLGLQPMECGDIVITKGESDNNN